MRTCLHRRNVALTVTVCLLSAPVLADSIPFQLTSTWQRVAAAGQTVDVQNTSGTAVFVSTANSGAAPALASGQVLLANQHRLYALGADLYASSASPLGGTVVVTPGVSAGGVVSQGAAGSTAWTTSDPQNAAFSDFTPLTIGGSPVQAGRSVEVIASVAGNVTFTFASGKQKVVPVSVGYQTFAYAVTGILASSATASFNNLY